MNTVYTLNKLEILLKKKTANSALPISTELTTYENCSVAFTGNYMIISIYGNRTNKIYNLEDIDSYKTYTNTI